jgi:transposase
MTPSEERAPVFSRYDPKQNLLLPPNLEDWLPEEHLARFISEIVEESLDLSPLIDRYHNAEGGHPALHPKMLTKLVVYGYAIGVRSSRKIERATYEDVAFRYLAANQHPDHNTIARFRERNLDVLEGLFIQGLKIAERMGLVKLGRVAIDGTKVRAHASKHKAMSYGRMLVKEKELQAKVRQLFAEARKLDREEDAEYGHGQLPKDLPEELKFHRTDSPRSERRSLPSRKRLEPEPQRRSLPRAQRRRATIHRRAAEGHSLPRWMPRPRGISQTPSHGSCRTERTRGRSSKDTTVRRRWTRRIRSSSGPR